MARRATARRERVREENVAFQVSEAKAGWRHGCDPDFLAKVGEE
jgi:hypothetical protein